MDLMLNDKAESVFLNVFDCSLSATFDQFKRNLSVRFNSLMDDC